MLSLKQLRLSGKLALQQQETVEALENLVASIERADKTITDLKGELEAVNVKHQARKTTRDDIHYLSDLLKCAQKKLAWEKQITSLQKRTPLVLDRMARLINDPNAPQDPQVRAAMLESLQRVSAAMERLQNAGS